MPAPENRGSGFGIRDSHSDSSSNPESRVPNPVERVSLRGHTILAVFAHPDDESLACGGTLARASDAGARVVVLCASRGESGSISDPALAADGDLGRARTRELQQAAGVLGVAELVVMDHRDGELRWSDLATQIALTIRRFRPDAVLTFDEDGLYWHPDHIGIHEHTSSAVQALGSEAPALYYVTIPSGAMSAVTAAARAKNGAPSDLSFGGIAPDAFGYAAPASTFVVDVRDWAARKLTALRCHRTQIGPHNPFAWIDDEEAQRLLGVEHFRRAPLGNRTASLLEQIGQAVCS